MKKLDKFGLNYHRLRFNHYFCVLRGVLSENTNGKNFSAGGLLPLPPPLRGSNAPIHTKITYDLTFAIIKKIF